MSDRNKAIFMGVVIGAFLGAAFAWIATNGEDKEGNQRGLSKLGPTDYFSISMSVLTLARQFGDMFK